MASWRATLTASVETLAQDIAAVRLLQEATRQCLEKKLDVLANEMQAQRDHARKRSEQLAVLLEERTEWRNLRRDMLRIVFGGVLMGLVLWLGTLVYTHFRPPPVPQVPSLPLQQEPR